MSLTETLRSLLGAKYVLTGDGTDRWARDWAGVHQGTPLAVLRPANTAEVSAILKLANETQTPVVPVSGNTSLAGGTAAADALLVSIDRMSAIREVRPAARTVTVEAGVVLSKIHDAVEEHGLIFPLFFGARGSAMIGGALSTNAGGSNVLRYGNTRDLCIGLEVVLPTGEIVNLMSALHKDNSGYNLRQLIIGAEGTLGIITAAVLKLHPKPRAYATAMVAMPSVTDALGLLNRLQLETGGSVQAFEYMPRAFIEAYLALHPEARAPFEDMHDINILVEVGAVAPRDAIPGADGKIPVVSHLEDVLGALFEDGSIVDAVVAQNETQREEMWARREASAEVSRLHSPIVDNDIAVPLDQMQNLMNKIAEILTDLDPDARETSVAHLGDGNLHFACWPSRDDPKLIEAIHTAVEDAALAMDGSFSAEHGIGTSKLDSMQKHKDPAAMAAMRAIKQALDPNNILNPGKVLPDAK